MKDNFGKVGVKSIYALSLEGNTGFDTTPYEHDNPAKVWKHVIDYFDWNHLPQHEAIAKAKARGYGVKLIREEPVFEDASWQGEDWA